MSLAQILYPAPTSTGLVEWSFYRYQHHLAIIGAVKTTKGLQLPVYPIWPFPPNNVATWLENHQLMHDEMDALYGINGYDLSSFDWLDEKQREGFFWLNYVEHRGVAQDCGVPI